MRGRERFFALTASVAVSLLSTILHGQDAIDMEIREQMAALHDDVRTSGLAAIRRNHHLTDDEFSARLVRLATVTTNAEDNWLWGFTVAALLDFGTTNALEFLENEALRGYHSGGIAGYGVITGFDDRFFALAERMLEDKSEGNWARRGPVYSVFESILCDDSHQVHKVADSAKAKAREALRRHSVSDPHHRVLIDMILLECDHVNTPYRLSTERRRLSEIALADAGSSGYARGYFQHVLRELDKEQPRSSFPLAAACLSVLALAAALFAFWRWRSRRGGTRRRRRHE